IWFALAVFTKTYEAGDPTEYTVTWSGTAKRGCGALAAAWSGVSKDAPINAHLGAASAGASATVRGPSVTTTTADCMIVMLGDYNATDTRTAPPGMEDVAGPEGIIAQVLQPEVKATGNKDAKTGKAEGNVGVLVALAPGCSHRRGSERGAASGDFRGPIEPRGPGAPLAPKRQARPDWGE